MTELLQAEQKDYLQSTALESEHGISAGRYDLGRYAVFGGSIAVLGVLFGVPGAGAAIEHIWQPPTTEQVVKPFPTDIVAGVPVRVYNHRSELECSTSSGSANQLLACGGEPKGFQLLVVQCEADIKNVREHHYSQSFGHGKLNVVPAGCIDEWVGVSAFRYNRVKDGGITIFPGKPDEHLTDYVS
jgi:hypothetical protein